MPCDGCEMLSSPVRSRSSYKSTFITVLLSTLQQTKENAELLDQLPDRTRAEARFGLGGATPTRTQEIKSTTPRAGAPPGVLVRPCNNMSDIGPRLRELPRYHPRLWPDLRLIWALACACCDGKAVCGESGDRGAGGTRARPHSDGTCLFAELGYGTMVHTREDKVSDHIVGTFASRPLCTENRPYGIRKSQYGTAYIGIPRKKRLKYAPWSTFRAIPFILIYSVRQTHTDATAHRHARQRNSMCARSVNTRTPWCCHRARPSWTTPRRSRWPRRRRSWLRPLLGVPRGRAARRTRRSACACR